MSRRHSLSFDMFTGVSRDMSGSLISRLTNIEAFDTLSLHLSWTAGPVGSFEVQIKNAKSAPNETDTFYALDFGSPLTVSALESELQIVLQKRPGHEMQITWTSTSGSADDLKCVLSAVSEGA